MRWLIALTGGLWIAVIVWDAFEAICRHDNQSWLAALTTILDASALVMVGIAGACARQAARCTSRTCWRSPTTC